MICRQVREKIIMEIVKDDEDKLLEFTELFYLDYESTCDDHYVLNTPGVTNFVGRKDEPIPLKPEEAERIIGREGDKDRKSVPFHLGDPIKVVDGPFTDFTGFVEGVNEEKSKVKVMVSIFGRATPVELDFLQVELEA